MACPYWWWLPGVGSRESLAGRVAGYVSTNLCGLPARAAQPDGARHKAQQASNLLSVPCGPGSDGSDREKGRTTRMCDVRNFRHTLRRRRELGLAAAAPPRAQTCAVCEGESINNDRLTLGGVRGECLGDS